MSPGRPLLKISLSKVDKVLELVGKIMLVLLWVQWCKSYSKLPDTIPVHFNFSGVADNYGSKQMLFALPILGTLIYLLLTWLNDRPNLYNYPTNITPENALAQYTIATKMVRILKLSVLIIFNVLVYKIIQSSFEGTNDLGRGVFSIILFLIIGPIVYFLWRSTQETK